MSKLFYESKTFWVNALTLASAAIAYGVDNEVFANPKVTAIAVTALSIVNLWLRFVTDKPISLKGVSTDEQL